MRTTKVQSNRDRAQEVINLSENLITLDIQARVKALDAMLKVYQSSFPFVRMSVDADAEAKLAKANKAATLAVGGTTPDERETAYFHAIRIYEKVYANLPGWSIVFDNLDTRLTELNRRREELMEAKRWALRVQTELEERFFGLMSLLNDTFGSFGVKFGVSSSQAKPRTFDAEKNIVFGLPYLETIKDSEPLSVLFEELHTVARALSVVRDGNGVATVDAVKVLAVLPELLKTLYTAAKKGGMSYSLNVERTETVKSAPKGRAWSHVPTVGQGGGLFRPGSYLSMIYDRLAASGGVLTFTDLFTGIPAKDPERMFQVVAERGLVANKFTLSRKGERIHFSFIGKK